ncbi:MAG: hypothetical protein ACXWDC_07870 [Aeromicrobium sp.]
MPIQRTSVPVLVAALILTACGAGDQLAVPAEDGRQAFVADIDDDAPDTCTPRAVGELVLDMFASINAGAVDVDSFIAPDADYQWFSVEGSGAGPKDAYDRSSLAAYFDSRIDMGEKIALIEMSVTHEPQRDLGHISFLLTRAAEDIPVEERTVVGKGAIDCTSGKIVVWAMGPTPDVRGPCGSEPGGVDGPDGNSATICIQPFDAAAESG